MQRGAGVRRLGEEVEDSDQGPTDWLAVSANKRRQLALDLLKGVEVPPTLRSGVLDERRSLQPTAARPVHDEAVEDRRKRGTFEVEELRGDRCWCGAPDRS